MFPDESFHRKGFVTMLALTSPTPDNMESRKQGTRKFILCLMAVAGFHANSAAAGSLPAFPEAEGYGAASQGGRGGRVIKVTNLNSEGPGSFNAACSASGPRIVVFDVAGVIYGDVAIRHSNITIAGQSAPSPGITLVGRLLSRPPEGERLKDVIVRFLRVRPPPTPGHIGDAVQLPHTERLILDHVSMSWANDETIDIIHSSDVTVQWSTIEESDPAGHDKGDLHNFGILSAYPGSGNVSIHHNLFAHHSRRLPSLSPREPDMPGDFRNNVIYNFETGLGHDGHIPMAGINIVGNYYKRGPNSEVVRPFQFVRPGNYFVADNYFEGAGLVSLPSSRTAVLPDWIKISTKGNLLDAPVKVSPVRTDTPQETYRRILQQAGTWPRDRVTQRTIKEVMNGTGSWGRHAPARPPSDWYSEGLAWERVQPDADNDGIPDEWERRHGLNPRDASDGRKIMKSGYAATEEYLNERARRLTPLPGKP